MRTVPSASQHDFAKAPQAEIPRSKFDRSHNYKTTFDSGYLIPFFWDFAWPADTFNVHLNALARLATPKFPVMDDMYLDTHFFAVPFRLVWDNWQKFMGEQKNPGDSIDYLIPQTGGNAGNGTLTDYFGIPTDVSGGSLTWNALIYRAYALIWNEWFRDQNLQDSIDIPMGDGPDDLDSYTLLRRGKRHDYFTSCLPWPQKGPAVTLPLVGDAPVYKISNAPQWQAYVAGTNSPMSGYHDIWHSGSAVQDSEGDPVSFDPNGSLRANLTGVTAATINELRQAFALQRLYERDARGGTRYTEIIRAHFGVLSPDARMQRPEYLGGGSTPVNVNPIAQTSAATGQPTPQGNLAAIGTATVRGHGFVKSFTEHTIIIGLMSVRASMSYQQGLNRMLSYRTKHDFYWPAFSHLGEQAVLRKEIYAVGNDDDDLVFGYQERNAELRYKPSLITGQFRSNYAQTLDSWHLAQYFETPPELNADFIQENPPIDRVIAVPSSPQFLFDGFIKMICARPMPMYSVPGLIDHF